MRLATFLIISNVSSSLCSWSIESFKEYAGLGSNTKGQQQYDKLHIPDHGRSIQEGYQPIVDITSTPPDGGSGVPDKDKI